MSRMAVARLVRPIRRILCEFSENPRFSLFAILHSQEPTHEPYCCNLSGHLVFGRRAGGRVYGEDAVQLWRAVSPGVITSGGMIVWVAGQTATQDSDGERSDRVRLDRAREARIAFDDQ